MTPSHARKGARKYRYYISSALLQGQTEEAGTVARVPATEIETLVAKALRGHFGQSAPADAALLMREHVARVAIHSEHLLIELVNAGASAEPGSTNNSIKVPWRKTPSNRRREILLPPGAINHSPRPIRSENRALLVASIARGRRWLNELLSGSGANIGAIAAREGCSARKVNMTISLAFLAPGLVKAAIEGRLPHGMGVARLCDLPPDWSRQYELLGLQQR